MFQMMPDVTCGGRKLLVASNLCLAFMKGLIFDILNPDSCKKSAARLPPTAWKGVR